MEIVETLSQQLQRTINNPEEQTVVNLMRYEDILVEVAEYVTTVTAVTNAVISDTVS